MPKDFSSKNIMVRNYLASLSAKERDELLNEVDSDEERIKREKIRMEEQRARVSQQTKALRKDTWVIIAILVATPIIPLAIQIGLRYFS